MLKFGNMLDAAVSFGTGIIGKWKLYAAILGLLVATNALSYCAGRDDGRDAERADMAKAERSANDAQNVSAGQAAGERQSDTATVTDNQKDRDNAITSAPPAPATDASNRLNCERLRKAGTDISNISACGGRATGAEAATWP